MPRLSKLARLQSCNAATTVAPAPVLLLNTSITQCPAVVVPCHRRSHNETLDLTTFFFSALVSASSCTRHKIPRPHFKRWHEPHKSRKDIGDARFIHTARRVNCDTAPNVFQARQKRSLHRKKITTTDNACHISTKDFDARVSPLAEHGFFDSTTRKFSKNSTLPLGFYEDLERVAGVKFDKTALQVSNQRESHEPAPAGLEDQVQLLKSVRELEEKLKKARSALDQSMKQQSAPVVQPITIDEPRPIVLSKQDYLNLVDLYYYSHQARFEPDSPDYSPSPLFLDDYSFELSKDFSAPTAVEENSEIDEEDTSILEEVHALLKSRQLREVSLMQAFIDLLLDDQSSNRALYEVYKMFPDPGMAYLPSGVIRLFLQRMSTPRRRTDQPMLRYLSLIDDMQRANLRITAAEWSSAIYLAGRSFSKVSEENVAKSFGIWRQMEQEAGVKATHVTFNILFHIAVRAEKYGLAQMILKEMHGRGLRLNRLGRVGLIYYHGMRGDGDGVRRAYRDFVEAGEIVDTLVLNCVMASLIKAQEAVAAEQIYERMKQLQTRLKKGVGEDGEEALFMKYPPPGSSQLSMRMASNSLGRVLLNASNLRNTLPEHHLQLQASMPLTPDQITYRSMIAHHASTSGDLDRLVVLMNDKTELIGLPLTALDFQLLFKGFAVHGAARGEERWTSERLDLVWKACQDSFMDAPKPRTSSNRGIEVPTVKAVDADLLAPADLSSSSLASEPDAWGEFILDLAAFPRQRFKTPVPFSHSVFPEDANSAVPEGSPDLDEGTRYSLPEAEILAPGRLPRDTRPSEVTVTRNLVIWLIRAYARCTASRRKLEDVWFEIRRLWKPLDDKERDAAVRVLRRALKDCDNHGTMD